MNEAAMSELHCTLWKKGSKGSEVDKLEWISYKKARKIFQLTYFSGWAGGLPIHQRNDGLGEGPSLHEKLSSGHPHRLGLMIEQAPTELVIY